MKLITFSIDLTLVHFNLKLLFLSLDTLLVICKYFAMDTIKDSSLVCDISKLATKVVLSLGL